MCDLAAEKLDFQLVLIFSLWEKWPQVWIRLNRTTFRTGSDKWTTNQANPGKLYFRTFRPTEGKKASFFLNAPCSKQSDPRRQKKDNVLDLGEHLGLLDLCRLACWMVLGFQKLWTVKVEYEFWNQIGVPGHNTNLSDCPFRIVRLLLVISCKVNAVCFSRSLRKLSQKLKCSEKAGLCK